MPDPDDILESASEEWIDRVSRSIQGEIISYFEGRFTALEDQVLNLRRYLIRTRFIEFHNELIRELADYRYNFETDPSTTADTRALSLQIMSECSDFMGERFLLVLTEINQQRTPELYLHQIMGQWGSYFLQRGLPHSSQPEVEPPGR